MDDDMSGWHHQQELEHQRYLEERWLREDPGYEHWLKQLEQQRERERTDL